MNRKPVLLIGENDRVLVYTTLGRSMKEKDWNTENVGLTLLGKRYCLVVNALKSKQFRDHRTRCQILPALVLPLPRRIVVEAATPALDTIMV
jgi:hypothetical protein